MKIEIPAIYQPLFEPKRYKVLSGGRGSAKSESVARYLLICASTKKERVLCTREYQKTISESVYLTIKDIILTHNMPNFEMTKSEIRNVKNGSSFLFTGLQDIDGIKSMKGITKCWCEEAHTLTANSIDILTPTIREDKSEIIFTFNRQEEKDPIWEKFCEKPREDVWHLHTTYRDNPFFPQVLRNEMEYDKSQDINLYNHKWEGLPRKNKGNLIDLEWFHFTSDIPPDNEFDYRFVVIDTAYKEKQENDYTVISYFGIINKRLYLIDVLRDKKKSIDVEQWAFNWIQPKLTDGFRNAWIEDKGHGIYLNQKFPKLGIPVPSEKQNHEVMNRRLDKVERANNAIAWINKTDKNVYINKNIHPKILQDITQEMVFFPNGAHDDFVDTFVDGIKIGLAPKPKVDTKKLDISDLGRESLYSDFR